MLAYMTQIHVGRSVARSATGLQRALFGRDVTCHAIGAWLGYVAVSFMRMLLAYCVEMKSVLLPVASAKCDCETDIDGVVQLFESG